MKLPKYHISILLIFFLLPGFVTSQDDLDSVLNHMPIDSQLLSLEERMTTAFYNDPKIMHELVNRYDSIISGNGLEDYRIQVFNFRGNAYYSNQQFDLALEQYLEAQTLAESGSTGLSTDVLYNNIAACYRFTSEGQRAITYYRKALDATVATQDSTRMAQTNNNLGMQLMETGNYQEAAPYLDEAVNLYQILKAPIYEGIARLTRANLNNELGLYTAALNDYQIAMDFVPETAAPIVHAASYAGMGSINRKLKNYSLSTEQLETSLRKAIAINHTEQMKESNRELSELYEVTGNFEKSLSHYKDYSDAKDSLFTAEQHNRLTQAISKFETDKKNQEIALLNEKQKVSNLQLAASKRRTIALGAGLGLLGLISFALLQFYRKIRSKNAIISNSLSEKELLLREIHHRVKNNLQFISSLLRLQSDHVDDPKALGALQQGHDRVRSMALIHQNLYKEENLTGVNTKDYFTKLITGLFKSNNIHEDRILLDLEVSELNLDVDTIVPIGLITNELVTNSLKYAFPGDRRGTIKVDMTESSGQLHLAISDDGIGMTRNQEDTLGSSFGYKLIRALVGQLEGQMSIDKSGGTSVNISLGKYEKV